MKTLENTFFRTSFNGLEHMFAASFAKSKTAAIIAAAVLAVLTAGTLAIGSAETADHNPVTVLAKSDRQDNNLPTNCQGQAWGAWSADCVATLTDNQTTRQIRFVTAEKPSSAPNVTVLERIPANG